MTTSLDIAMIANYALENRQNLEIALKLAKAATEIRNRIVRRFLEKLEGRLLEKLSTNDWEITNELKEDPSGKDGHFGIRKKNWPSGYLIAICSDKKGAGAFFLGISKPAKGSGIAQLDSEIRHVLDREIRPGSQTDLWCWWIWLEKPYRDWNEVEALAAFFDEKDALKWFSDCLLRMKRLTEEIFDKYARTVP